MIRLSHKLRLVAIVCAALILAGCKETPLYHKLSEQEANEMVALMHRAGIPATKLPGKENTYTVSTEQDTFAAAMQLLKANNLPKQQFETLGSVFSGDKIVTTGQEVHSRYIYALSEEMAHTISSIDGVVLARVHLSVPKADALAEIQPKSSASVMVKHRKDVELSRYVGQIKALVVNGLENLKYDDVTVMLVEAEPLQDAMNNQPLVMQSGEFRMSSVKQMGSGLVLPALLMVLASIAGFGLYWKQRKPAADNKSQ